MSLFVLDTGILVGYIRGAGYAAYIERRFQASQHLVVLILKVVKEAIKRGASPEQVSEAIPWKRVFLTIEGEWDENEFLARVNSIMAENGRSFDGRRYFTSDDELIHFGNKTYAFTNQWGGPRTFQAIENIIEQLQASDISFTPMA